MSSNPGGFDHTQPSALPVDVGGIPTAACAVCGCTWIVTSVNLDPETYEIASWLLHDARCHDCGSIVTLACPPDHPEFRAELY